MKFSELGPYFKEYREMTGLTPNAVSKMVHVDNETITKLENCDSNMKLFRMLDDLMKVYHMEIIPISQSDKKAELTVNLDNLSPAHRRIFAKMIEDEQARLDALDALNDKDQNT